MNPGDLTPAAREKLRTDAMLHPAPDLPGLATRPFNDTVLALCGQAGLTIFTLEAFNGDVKGMPEKAAALGLNELNRQTLCLLFIVGFPEKKEMLRALRTPGFYEETVLPWALDLPPDPARMARLLGEWQRYMMHTAASIVQVLPKEDSADPNAPPNS